MRKTKLKPGAKGYFIEKLGLKPATTLTKTVCLERSKTLRKRLEKGVYEGRLRDQAVYYAAWYKWRATNKRSA